MKNVLTKLAEIATKLDEAGHTEQANKIDAILQQLASDIVVADQGAPYMGAAGLSEEDLAELQGRAPVQLPPSVSGKIVMRGKTPDAAGYGFFGTDQIEKAVKEGKVDQAVAIKAMQDYLQNQGYPNIGQTLPELVSGLVGGVSFPIKGKQEPELYGAKSFWQKIFGK